MSPRDVAIRRAGVDDADDAARMLHDFNREFDDPTPPVPALAERLRHLIEAGEVTILLGGDGPDGIAVLRLRLALWSDALDAYLEELYVAPARRGKGIGRALLEATMEAARAAGATRIELGTSVDDEAAIALYERRVHQPRRPARRPGDALLRARPLSHPARPVSLLPARVPVSGTGQRGPEGG